MTNETTGAPRSAYVSRDDYVIVTMESVEALGSWEAAGVFQRIAYRSEREGSWAASMQTIADEVRLTRAQVRRALDIVREAGWITSEREHARDSTQRWSPVWDDARPMCAETHHDVRPDAPGGAPERTTPSSQTTKTRKDTHGAAAPSVPTAEAEAICQHFADRLEGNGRKRPTISKPWLRAAQTLIDEQGVDVVRSMIDWAQSSTWWRSRTVTPMRLVSHWDTIRQQRADERGKHLHHPEPEPGYVSPHAGLF